jgi:Bax protein
MNTLERITSKAACRVGSLRCDRGTASIAVIALAVTVAVTSMMHNLMDEWHAMSWHEAARPAAAPLLPVTRRPLALSKPSDVQVLANGPNMGFKASVARVKDVFSTVGYNLEAVRNGEIDVPRIQYASFPHDLKEVAHTPERKALFLCFILPYVLEANNEVRQQRHRVERLRDELVNGVNIDPVDAEWLDQMFQEYKIRNGDIDLLLRRVDIVPPSLALAQSAIESGWGTSRFAREGNAAFGQWTTAEYTGIVPLDREDGRDHKIRSFSDLKESVNSYVRNLNTHRAYVEFRKLRAQQRQSNAPINSASLAATLTRYSEKGAEYVKLLRQIIAGNKLRTLDDARLGDTIVALRPDA